MALTIGLLLLASWCLGQNNGAELANKCAALIDAEVQYVPAYVSLAYPMGDVPSQTGVCTDVIIRALRLIDMDLQQLVHEDMQARFNEYPQRWGMNGPDPNIDHRRVPNLMEYFDHCGWSETISEVADDYQPGDIVAWDLGNGILHIGLVRSIDETGTRWMLHNIGNGQIEEDILFNYEIIGHYRLK